MAPIEDVANNILVAVVKTGKEQVSAGQIQELTKLDPTTINVAVRYLSSIGAIDSVSYFGTAPFDFGEIFIKSLGRYMANEPRPKLDTQATNHKTQEHIMPVVPIGSPFGFTESDWSSVVEDVSDVHKLKVVLGLQYDSKYYKLRIFTTTIEDEFRKALNNFNIQNKSSISLQFVTLEAGFGEHLFNGIARSIIGADISVFETSDLNPNVMIEMGVALTWGVAVVPIRSVGAPTYPSDISGQTWVKYRDSGRQIVTEDYEKKFEALVRTALIKKPGKWMQPLQPDSHDSIEDLKHQAKQITQEFELYRKKLDRDLSKKLKQIKSDHQRRGLGVSGILDSALLEAKADAKDEIESERQRALLKVEAIVIKANRHFPKIDIPIPPSLSETDVVTNT